MAKDRVLLVDDEVDFLEALAERLTRRGLDVTCAASGSEALRIIDEKNFDAAAAALGDLATVAARATLGVTIALILILAPSGLSSQIHCPSWMPALLASAGLTSANISCWSSASHGLERVSSPPPSYSTSRPLVMISGYSAV